MKGLTIEVRNEFSELHRVSEMVDAWLDGQAPDVFFTANLLLEELLTNIFRNGSGVDRAREIRVHLSINERRLTIAVHDDGCAFNPLEHPAPDTSLPAKDRKPGGLGIHLIREMSDSFLYERIDGVNVVTLKKAL